MALMAPLPALAGRIKPRILLGTSTILTDSSAVAR